MGFALSDMQLASPAFESGWCDPDEVQRVWRQRVATARVDRRV